MISLVILIPLYWLAVMAIVDALTAKQTVITLDLPVIETPPAYAPIRPQVDNTERELSKPLQPSVFEAVDFELTQATGNVINVRGKLCTV